MPVTAEDFQKELDRIFVRTKNLQLEFTDIRSGDLHTTIGDYPGQNHRMPTCCKVMKNNMKNGDEILDQPTLGNGASLIIRYYFPR